MSGEAGEELDTPAARIMARRESRAAMPDRLKEAAADDSSDEEWIADDHEDQEEDGRVYLDASKCGRVRLHAVQGAAQSSSGLGVDDERRKSLADKGWARRTVVVNSVGASGAASFELVPGREQFGPGKGFKEKIKGFRRGASYAAREKGAKRGSKRDKRDAVTPAAGSGGQGDQAGDRATLRDRVGRRAGSLSRVHPTRLRGAWPRRPRHRRQKPGT